MKPFDLSALETLYRAHSDPAKAAPMKKYLLDQYEFLGIKAPEARALQKQYFSEYQFPDHSDWDQVIKHLWNLPEREFQHFGLDLLVRRKRKITPDDLPLFEYMTVNKSWWDIVDMVAMKLIGQLFQKWPELIEPHTKLWRNSNNLWLQRTCIIFQNKYKSGTDEELLFNVCKQFATSDEFFLRKAIGWALREYSKTNPAEVKAFVAKNEAILSNLSKREALKHFS